MDKTQKKDAIFLNLTNHASADWSDAQREAAEAYGRIVDFPFPAVSAQASAEDVRALAGETAARAAALHPRAVLCQGEFTCCFAIVRALQARGIPVCAATSERQSEEITQPDGSTKKLSIFHFVQFRFYEG
jgi:ketopantoate hydroxymethyltransferase